MSPSSPLEVVAAIIEKEGKFLITQRLKQSHLGHCWEFPGGKQESGETLEECIIRECQEEIGVEIKPLQKVKEIWHTYKEVSVHLHFFLCELVSGTPQALECADLKWVFSHELKNFEFPEADQKILEKLSKNQEDLWHLSKKEM